MGDADKTAPTKIETLCVVTRCATRMQFVTMFRRFCTRTSCFVPCSAHQARPVGVLVAFQLQLADHTLVLHGDGVVIDSWTSPVNPFKRPGIVVEINRLTPESKELFDEITVPRSSATRVPLATQLKLMQETLPNAAPHLLASDRPDEELPPLKVDTPARAVVPTSAPLQRAQSDSSVVPANPLTEMTDDLLDAFVESHFKDDIAPLHMVPAGKARDASTEPVATIAGAPVHGAHADPPEPATGPASGGLRAGAGLQRGPGLASAATRAIPQRRPPWQALLALWSHLTNGGKRWWLPATVASLVVVMVVVAWTV